MNEKQMQIFYLEKQIDEMFEESPLNWSDKTLREYLECERILAELRKDKK